MIKMQLQDDTDLMEFDLLVVPLLLTPIINETDVQTIDGNISTHYSSTKRAYSITLGYLDADTYASLKGFRDRQYENLKYPKLTLIGNSDIAVSGLTGKLSINDQEIVNACGLVGNVVMTFRESKQMS